MNRLIERWTSREFSLYKIPHMIILVHCLPLQPTLSLLWKGVNLQFSKCAKFLLGPWKELFTNIAKKEDLFSVTVMGSLLSCQYFAVTFTLWSLNFTLMNATTELLITFGYMYFFCWVAESYFGRMFVHTLALIITLTGCFVSFLNELSPLNTLKFEPFLLRPLLSSMPLQAAAVLSERNFIKKIISLDNFLFLVLWLGLIGSAIICVIAEEVIESKHFRKGLSLAVTIIVIYQLLIVLMKCELFQDSSFHYNIHYAVSRVILTFLTTKLTGFAPTTERAHRIVKKAAVVVIRMSPFLISLFMFAASVGGVLFLLTFQYVHVSTSAWMPQFTITTLTCIVSAAILPIMYLYVFPTCHKFKLLKTDLQKIGLCFWLLAFCLLYCCGVQYVLNLRVKPFPPSNYSQLNVVNGFDSALKVLTTQQNETVQPHQLYTVINDFNNQTTRWLVDIYNCKHKFHEQLDLTAMSKLVILCVASKLGLDCKGIFSTSPPLMFMIPPRSSTICLINTLPSEVVAVFTDPVNQKNFSLLALPNQICDKIAGAKQYDITVFSKENKLIFMKSIDFPDRSAIALYIFSENENTKLRVLTLANTKVLPEILLFPSLLFFGLCDSIAMMYMFRFCYEQSPETLLATLGTFAYTVEIGPKMLFTLVGGKEINATFIFSILLVHITFSIIHVLITIKIEFYKDLDRALRSSTILGRYVPSSVETIQSEQSMEIKKTQDVKKPEHA